MGGPKREVVDSCPSRPSRGSQFDLGDTCRYQRLTPTSLPNAAGPVLAFQMAVTVEILISLLKDAGMPVLLPVVASIGWSLFRKLWVRQRGRPPVET